MRAGSANVLNVTGLEAEIAGIVPGITIGLRGVRALAFLNFGAWALSR